jgi:uncharacterized membrane protein YedE/YeeE
VLQLIVSFITGLLFALGLIVSGMSNPAKVLNFLDVTGTWDPTLAVVMGSALLVAFPSFRLVLKQPKPLLSERFHLPSRLRIDPTLLCGAAIFGIGWGLAGLCPGPALSAAGSGSIPAFVFTAAMIVGARAWNYLDELRSRARSSPSVEESK